MGLEELEKIVELEAKLKQRLIIPLTEVRPASLMSVVLLLIDAHAPPKSTLDVVSFLARKHKCKVKLVCLPQEGVDCRGILTALREQLKRKVGDVEEYVSTDDVASFISSITEGDSLSLIAIPSPKSMEDSLKLIESLFQKLGFPILIIERSDISPEDLLGNVLILVREPNEIKDPLPILTAICADKAKMTFLTYIGESFLASVDFLCTILSELTTVEKEKLVSSAYNVIEKAIKEVEPALVSQGFQVNHLVEAGSVDEASISLMKKTGAHLIAIPVKVKMRPETKLILIEAASSFLLIPKHPPAEGAEVLPTPPKKTEKEENS